MFCLCCQGSEIVIVSLFRRVSFILYRNGEVALLSLNLILMRSFRV